MIQSECGCCNLLEGEITLTSAAEALTSNVEKINILFFAPAAGAKGSCKTGNERHNGPQPDPSKTQTKSSLPKAVAKRYAVVGS